MENNKKRIDKQLGENAEIIVRLQMPTCVGMIGQNQVSVSPGPIASEEEAFALFLRYAYWPFVLKTMRDLKNVIFS